MCSVEEANDPFRMIPIRLSLGTSSIKISGIGNFFFSLHEIIKLLSNEQHSTD